MGFPPCNRWFPLAMLLALAGISVPCLSQDVTHLYTDEELRRAGSVYARNIQGMWEEDFLARLDAQERRRAGSVSLLLPPVGENRHPLDYYANAASRQVYIPISSVKFLDDLSIALAYYERHNCDLSVVSDYAALLKARPGDISEPPLAALGVPDDALDDFFVDDVSQKLLKSTLFFLAGHEYAHVMYAHDAYSVITPDAAQAQEIEADAFALDVMRRIAVAPLALSHFFMVSTRLEPLPQDFPSEAEYRAHLSTSTHPVSAQRLESVAGNIETHLTAYSSAQSDPEAFELALAGTVGDLRNIARELDDSSMRHYLSLRLQDMEPQALRSACQP